MALVDDLIKYIEAIHSGRADLAETIRLEMAGKYDKAITVQDSLIDLREDLERGGLGHRTLSGYKELLDQCLDGKYKSYTKKGG